MYNQFSLTQIGSIVDIETSFFCPNWVCFSQYRNWFYSAQIFANNIFSMYLVSVSGVRLLYSWQIVEIFLIYRVCQPDKDQLNKHTVTEFCNVILLLKSWFPITVYFLNAYMFLSMGQKQRLNLGLLSMQPIGRIWIVFCITFFLNNNVWNLYNYISYTILCSTFKHRTMPELQI